MPRQCLDHQGCRPGPRVMPKAGPLSTGDPQVFSWLQSGEPQGTTSGESRVLDQGDLAMSEDQSAEQENSLSLPAGEAGEYLEKLVAARHKEQLDQEENVWRSLPFFATSLGVLVAFVGIVRPLIPAWSWPLSPAAGILYVFLLLLVASLFGVLYFLAVAAKQRRITEEAGEDELLAYASGIVDFYDETPLTEEQAEQAMIEDLRSITIRQLADIAMVRRSHNEARHQARGRAFFGLILALVCALIILGVILATQVSVGALAVGDQQHERVESRSGEDAPREDDQEPKGHRDHEAGGAADAPAGNGGVVLPGDLRSRGTDEGDARQDRRDQEEAPRKEGDGAGEGIISPAGTVSPPESESEEPDASLGVMREKR